MKLRQKLAMVLAAATVVTTVPVVTFAASTNTIVNKQVGKKDRVYGHEENDLTTGPILKVKLDDSVDTTEHGGVFYLDVEGFEFDQAQYNRDNEIFTNLKAAQGTYVGVPTGNDRSFGNLTVQVGKKCLKVDLSGYYDVYGTTVIPEDTTLFIPLYGKVTGDIATVTIDNNQLEITGGTALTFAESKGEKCTVTAEDVTDIFDEGTIGDIVFSEAYANIIKSKYEDGKFVTKSGKINDVSGTYDYFEIKLATDNQEFEFVESQDVEVELGKGFEGTWALGGLQVTSKYGDEVTILIPVMAFQNYLGDLDTDGEYDKNEFEWVNSKGIFRIKGVEVRANTKTPTAGDLTIDVKGDLGEATALKVANVVLTDTKLYMKDEKTVEITAGKSEDVTFFLEENVADGILPNHTVDFELSKGYFGVFDEETFGDVDDATRSEKVTSFKNLITLPTNVDVVDVEMDGTKYVGFTAKFVAKDMNGDGDFTDHGDINAAPINSKDKYEFKAPLCVDLDTEDATEIKITASGERAIDEEVSTVAAKVVAPVKVEAEAMVVKVGLQKQKYEGKLTITETANGKIGRGDLVIATPAEGYKFTGKGEVKVTSGDLIINKWENKKDQIIIEVKNASKTASTIEITGFEVDVDRTVPEGTFALNVKGSSLVSEHEKDGRHAHGSIEVKDFFRVNTPNTEDIKSGALKAVEVSFTAGSTEYTVDGVTKTMDAAAYIQNDRTMVPVRYLSDAFGISPENILFNDGVVTVIAGEKIVQLKVGSDMIIVNGMSIKMDAKAEVKNGRSYVPMKFIAAALGVNSTWDSATKTATFSNKN